MTKIDVKLDNSEIDNTQGNSADDVDEHNLLQMLCGGGANSESTAN